MARQTYDPAVISGVLSGGRAWVKDRTRTQKGGAAAAVVLAATAPFGGLAPVAEPPVPALEVAEPFQLGPFEVTVARAVTTPELEPLLTPERKGNRILSVVLEVTNTTDRPETLIQLTDAISLSGAGIVPATDPSFFLLLDSSNPRWLNPGVTNELALSVEHDPSDDAPLVVETLGYDYVDESSLTLYEDYWSPTDEAVRRGEIPVEERE